MHQYWETPLPPWGICTWESLKGLVRSVSCKKNAGKCTRAMWSSPERRPCMLMLQNAALSIQGEGAIMVMIHPPEDHVICHSPFSSLCSQVPVWPPDTNISNEVRFHGPLRAEIKLLFWVRVRYNIRSGPRMVWVLSVYGKARCVFYLWESRMPVLFMGK